MRFVLAATVTLLVTLQCARGDLELLLSGYTGIPTDGSAVLPIPGIGPHYEGMALICQHGITGIPPSAAIDKWFLVHENGDEEEVGISGNTGFTLSRGQNDGVVRLERNSGSSSLEGVYKCVVEANPTESVTVYLYWPITELEVTIEVLSQTVQMFTVTCLSEGGRVVSSSLTGPNSENLGQLQPVEEQYEGRGDDHFSLSVTRPGGEDGDVFTCTASTEWSTHTSDSVLSVAGHVESIVVTQIPSLSPTLNISWSPPQNGAPVTGYTIHYTSPASVGGSEEHNGTVFTSENETSVVLNNLIADGRAYSVIVEVHSLHLSSFSQPQSHTPCIVSQLSVMSRTHTSLSLSWDRPLYFTDDLRGVVEYVPLGSAEGSDSRWLYVDGVSNDMLALTGLEEFSNYSIRMAVVDGSDRLCTFNEPIIALTGLGPVKSLQTGLEVDAIQLSWSPPLVPSTVAVEYTVAYTTGTNGVSRTTTTVTTSLTWRIRAEPGELFTIAVTPNTDSGSGETVETTIGIDYKAFQIRIEDIERCGDLLEDRETMVVSVTEEVQKALRNLCSCDAQIKEPAFHCQSNDQDFVVFQALLFAPFPTTSDQLLSLLQDWVISQPNIYVTSQFGSINPGCLPTDSVSDCATLSSTEPSTSPSSNSTREGFKTDSSGEGFSLSALAGTAVGCFVLGILSGLIAVPMYILRRQRIKKRGFAMQRRAHGVLNSNDCEGNPRYVSSDEDKSKMQDRQLPLLPLVREENGFMFTNPVLNEGATRNICTEGNEAYETLSTSAGKVQNPMYDVVDEATKARKDKRHQLTASGYVDVGSTKTVPVWPQDEYVTMLSNATNKGDNPA